MKKVISSLLVLSMALFTTVAQAGNLTVEQAKTVGCYYVAQQMGIGKLAPENLVLAYQFENPDMNVASAYVFNLNVCEGWVIIAGTSVVDPIIAFSDEGSLDMNNIPDNLRWWLTNYTDVITDIQLLDATNDYPDSERYSTLMKEGAGNGAKDNQMIKLMASRWDQGDTRYPDYNYYCPTVNGRYSVTGCVATAIAQICNYYKYPVKPKGTVAYNWNNVDEDTTIRLSVNLDSVVFDYSLMPNRLTSSSSLDEIKEVAMLNYCIGVGVKMDYHPDGSGANMTDEAGSFMRGKFKYERNAYRLRRSSGTDTSFVNTIRRNMMAGDVLAMHGASSQGSGADAAGHAWVVCGYQTEDTRMYYMNWGWGGTGNGFFNLEDNNMYISSQGYNFNLRQGCFFGMLPPEDSNIHHSHVAIREVDNTLLGSAYPNPAALSVSLPYSTEVVADLQVYSIDGKLVATRRMQPGSGVMTLRVDALPKGVYVYRMNGQSGKFIVQ